MRTEIELAKAIALHVIFMARTVNDINSTLKMWVKRPYPSRHFLQLLFAQLFELLLLCLFHDLSSFVFFYDLHDVKIGVTRPFCTNVSISTCVTQIPTKFAQQGGRCHFVTVIEYIHPIFERVRQ